MIKNIKNMDYSQNHKRFGEYIEALQEERRKILVFQRELPLCLELVTQAIEACKRETSDTMENMNGQSECSEQSTGDCGGLVLEEFIPIKPSFSSAHDDDDDEEEEEDEAEEEEDSDEHDDDKNPKSDWLKSVQLWNQPDTIPIEERSREKETVVEVKNNGVMCEKSNVDVESRKTPATADGGGGGRKNEAVKDAGGKRKQRRCWSQDLHRRFLNALQQLGGAQVATPKQIRELMKVDGLTNDEVKSHLQKYRLHTRRPSQTAGNGGNNQTPHFVVVGGIWVPQATAKSAAATSATAGIYGDMADPAPPQWPSHWNNFGPLISHERSICHIEGGVRRIPPAMSSSSPKDRKKS
ncbi:PREDICTED: myb family transcription factor EFM-like [Tarenaya hassleriana]|uniref:myb family transcription factor EFM-like n=1 Tax=Tarenaya hassleriana TaxID=28532 RepID=UPI00053C90E5|nr:PREDICTED: myb family transcription factor EFM-like [Tarenaya hassleriana]